ncbi:carboxylesterase/lipase family protein [Curtobacterium ammoniigenes]|uniref:carboxylesterase/lipase family protein n=1 Tax=Curtobacterium ammoniigenes TaxID=395387 RepID=UPI0009FA5F78|nr:carboxylesterase/lipase family protein [Curtobacterium ammoniigenes]
MTSTLSVTDALTVTTASGSVRGAVRAGIRRWMGIPYAAAPVGQLRWHAPQPVEPWRGVRAATEPGAACPQQPHPFTGGISTRFAQSEDCLTLNVFSPFDADRLPVLVFIHGGAYRSGASGIPEYDGTALARRGVVVVTLSYRLGVFGSMDLRALNGDGIAFDANCTLRDQVAALQWVRDAIAGFGGDPGRVTIVGESSGGNAITTLLATPSARGLFQAAIAQSPHPQTAHRAEKKAPHAEMLAERLGVDRRHAAREMLRVPASRLLTVAAALDRDITAESPLVAAFSPTIDGDVLPEHPLIALRNGRAASVPLIIGTNRDEYSLFEHGRAPVIPNTEARVRQLVEGTDPAAWARIRVLYGERAGGGAARVADARRAWSIAGGDGVFRVPSIEVADAHAEAGNPTWMYRYDHASPTLRLTGLGAAHGTELPYLFGTFGTPVGRLVAGADAARVRRRIGNVLQGSWTGFVRDGVPAHRGWEWPRYETDRRRTLAIETVSRVLDDPDREARLAWSGVLYDY